MLDRAELASQDVLVASVARQSVRNIPRFLTRGKVQHVFFSKKRPLQKKRRLLLLTQKNVYPWSRLYKKNNQIINVFFFNCFIMYLSLSVLSMLAFKYCSVPRSQSVRTFFIRCFQGHKSGRFVGFIALGHFVVPFDSSHLFRSNGSPHTDFEILFRIHSSSCRRRVADVWNFERENLVRPFEPRGQASL